MGVIVQIEVGMEIKEMFLADRVKEGKVSLWNKTRRLKTIIFFVVTP